MYQGRIHGRGGQGVVTAAELLSVAAFHQGRHAQAFPSFGSERMGAPVMAFCRIDSRPIQLREPVMKPDALIIQDVTLVSQAALFSGLSPRGVLLVNSPKQPADLALPEELRGWSGLRICCVPATALALQFVKRAVPNVPLLGAFCALTGEIALEGLKKSLHEKFSKKIADANISAAQAAFEQVAQNLPQPAGHAQPVITSV